MKLIIDEVMRRVDIIFSCKNKKIILFICLNIVCL